MHKRTNPPGFARILVDWIYPALSSRRENGAMDAPPKSPNNMLESLQKKGAISTMLRRLGSETSSPPPNVNVFIAGHPFNPLNGWLTT